MEGSILPHTRSLAAELASRFAHDPAGELDVWTTTAQQREAMVVNLYDADAIQDRLPKRAGEPDVLPVIRKAIGGIWAQERSHTTLIGSLRVVDEKQLTILRSLLGTIEGVITHCATANGWRRPLTNSLVGVGRVVGLAPEFTKAFHSLTLRQFLRFSHELETTAKEGYERILQLLEALDQAGDTLKFGVTGPYEFAKTLAEERFHAAVFEQLDNWLAPDELAFVDIPAHGAVVQLHRLALEHLSLSSPSFGPATRAALRIPWTKSARDDRLVSDGGLGELFADFGLPLPAIAALPGAVRDGASVSP
jgi:hypothetical protein